MGKYVLEVCAGSLADCVAAYEGGSSRVELNYGLFLGGLTPTSSAVRLAKEYCPGLSVMAMVRPRGAGFCYTDLEYEVMKAEAEEMIAAGADGIVFGILKSDRTFDVDKMRVICDIAKNARKNVVMHRAFDCVDNQDKEIEELIKLGFDRVLTSGGASSADKGIAQLRHLNSTYGKEIDIMPGNGVKAHNARYIIEETGVSQIHSSCSEWFGDPTTINGEVSYGFSDEHPSGYNGASVQKVREMVASIDF